MRQYGKMAAAALACALLLRYPQEALEAALEAMRLWARAFAPALFPFFAVMPALCCKEAAALYEKVFGRIMGSVCGCPGRAAGPIVIGWMAGSPAGALALGRVKEGMTAAQATRALLLCSGLSPAFLIASVGGVMLGDAGAGRMLLRAQMLATAASAPLMRRMFSKSAGVCRRAPEAAKKEHPVREAVLSVVTVCGWMVCFSVLSRLATMGLPGLRAWILPFLEVAGGCAAICDSALPAQIRIGALGFFCGLGGLSLLMQNSAQAPEVKKTHLALGKLLQGALCALCAWAQCAVPPPAPDARAALLAPAALALALPVAVFLWSRARRPENDAQSA